MKKAEVLLIVASFFTAGCATDQTVQTTDHPMVYETTEKAGSDITENLKYSAGAEPLRTWLESGSDMLLLADEMELSVLNLETYEKQVISSIHAEWMDRQPDDGIKLTLDFSDETEGLLRRIEAGVRFLEKRNFNFGGEGGHSLLVNKDMSLLYDEPQNEIRYPIADWRLAVKEVEFAGNIIVRTLPYDGAAEIHGPGSYVFTGDRLNPFSLLHHSGEKPASWVSDFRKADIICRDNVVLAINRETLEEVLLLKINEQWKAAAKDAGQYSFELEDLSGGLITGGALKGTFTSGGIDGKRANVFIHAFSFGDHEIITKTEYQAGPRPRIIYSLSDADDAVLNSKPVRDRFGTLMFKDGNVLKFSYLQ